MTVSGNNASRVFNVREGNLTVKRLTVSDGNATTGCCDAQGGGIYVTSSPASNLEVIESIVSGNRAGSGGGIYSSTNLDGTSTTTIVNSTISGNTATGEAGKGGGIYNFDGRMYITGSTITKNYAPTKYQSSGGGAGVASFGDTFTETVVANSIISDNSSNCSEASACNFRHDGDVDFVNSTHNSFTSQGHNIIGDSSLEWDPNTCGQCKAIDAFNKTGDQRGVTDPKLGPLQDNGGLTQTHALLTGSPAINRGSTTLATDQRGVSRPQGAADDVGAFELEWVNTAPGASEQSVTTSEDVAKPIALSATDADSNPLTYKVTSLPSNGKLYKGNSTAADEITNASLPLTLPSGGNQVTYAPNANYNNTAATADTFEFKANDGTVDGNEATVTVTVSPVDDSPEAVNDTATVAEDDAATAIDVLANDTDTDGGPKTIASVTQPTNGTVVITGSGSGLTYQPNADSCNGGSPTDDFNYTLDGGSTAKVAVTVTCANDAPVAKDESGATDEDTALNNINVLGNDTDVENDALSISSFDATSLEGGSVTKNDDGTFNYTPKNDFVGTDSFTYKAKDASLDSNSAKVTITVRAVNDAPVAKDNTYTTEEDTPLAVAAPGLLGNDTDVENDTLRVADGNATTADGISPVSGPADGTVTLDADGSFTYMPNANFNGSDSFTYRVCDNGSPQKCSVETAKVNVTIKAVNDAPVATNDSLTTDEDTAGNGNVLTNDTDVDNADLTAALVSGPSHGTLNLNADGSYTYTPSNNFFGSDSFTYKANDGGLVSNTATVNITVNPVDDPLTVTLAPGGSCSTGTTGVSGSMNLSLADVDSSGVLALSATSSNPALVPAAQDVVAVSAPQRVVTLTAVQGIVAGAAVDHAARVAPADQVVTGARVDGAVAVSPEDHVRAGGAGYRLLLVCAHDDPDRGGARGRPVARGDGDRGAAALLGSRGDAHRAVGAASAELDVGEWHEGGVRRGGA